MTEITDGSGVTYPAEAYQAVFMEAHRLRARLTESEAENERLRVQLDECENGWRRESVELERLRAALREIEGGSHPLQMVRVASAALNGA